MTITPLGRITRISFLTDMTRADAPVIPLGYMLEAAWPEKARWLGLVGRMRLTPLELDRVNKTTWPELHNPFATLADLFEKGWDAQWGEAGTVIQNGWSRSAFSVETSEHQIGPALSAESAEAWGGTCNLLCAELNALRVKLAPTLIAQPIRLQPAARKTRPPTPEPTPPPIARPIDMRMRDDVPMAA
jgi:hypothetical protein